MNHNFILDASFALSWCFIDETTSDTEEVQIALSKGAIAYVPEIWLREILNTLLVGERRGRIESEASEAFLADLQELPIKIVDKTVSWKNLRQVREAGRKHQLSAYDAEYFVLAKFLKLGIASFDKNLRAAAIRENISVIPA